MPVPSLPYSFGPGTLISSAQVDANFVTIYNWANGGVDNANVGTAGFYASQIKPINPTTATFGGTFAYTFPAGINAGGPLTATTGAYSGTTTNSNTTTAFYSSAAPGVAVLQWVGGSVGGAVNNLKTNPALVVNGIGGHTAVIYNGTANANMFSIDDQGNVGVRSTVQAVNVVSGTGSAATLAPGDGNFSRSGAAGALQFGTGGGGNSGLLDYGNQYAGAFSFFQVGGTLRDLYAGVFRGTGAVVSAAAVSAPAGAVAFGNGTATSASAGANGAPPAQVLGYLIANIGGTNVKLPYYAV